ncbi:ABC transporter permease [Yinghuangia soli]|uniref:ABC transporter permease n=1 Tax=Yinghuangia soli TaxID=2908204 RepID=A0AA41Q7D0_9ACTN|nr:ABC transporter permease [Yinghuangia soli]MCF2532960.1 ABC transporter permease [Yinghuangia soli]
MSQFQVVPDGGGLPTAGGEVEPEAFEKAPAEKAIVGRSPRQLAWIRFRRDKAGVVSGCVVLFFVLIAVFAPLIAKLYGKDPYTHYGNKDPNLLNDYGFPMKPNGGMDGEYWFGVDPTLGRDVFTQLLYGIRTSLLIAVIVVLLVTAIGTVLGILAGYLGGKTDFIVSRAIDVLLAIPSQLFFIAFTPVAIALMVDDSARTETPVVVQFMGVIVVLTIFGWCRIARVLRGQVLSLREREFVEAAKVSGASSRRIVFRELLPNLWAPILIVATVDVPTYVVTESALSFLGVGVQEPTPDWGRMIRKGFDQLSTNPSYIMFPAIAMLLFVLAFNLLGDAVRDALDPKSDR